MSHLSAHPGVDGERELIFSNAQIVLPDDVIYGHVVVRDGKIVEIGTDQINQDAAIDMGGDYLLPGLMDVHTDHMEKHIQPRVQMTWNPLSAAVSYDAVLCAAGITTVLDSLVLASSESPERRASLPLMLEGFQQAREAGLLRTDHYLHLRCDLQSDDVAEEAARYVGQQNLKFVTLMDDGPLRSVERYRRNRRNKGVPEESINATIVAAREHGAKRQALVELFGAAGVPMASHDDMTAAHIAESVGFGMTISEFPISRESADAAHTAGLAIITGAPNIVAGRSHIGNVSAVELAENGLIDVVCSDYIPASLLHGLWRLTREPVGMSLPAAIALGSSRPAVMFGFADRGRIAEGCRADLIRVAVHQDTPVVRGTWVEGRPVF